MMQREHYSGYNWRDSKEVFRLVRLVASGKSTQKAIQKATGKKQSTTAEKLCLLVEKKILSFDMHGKEKHYFVNFEGINKAYKEFYTEKGLSRIIKSRIGYKSCKIPELFQEIVMGFLKEPCPINTFSEMFLLLTSAFS